MSRGRPPLPIQRPVGFTLLGLYLGWKALSGFFLALGVNLSPGGLDDGISRPALLLAVFAAVAAESLFRCRPWCARATVAYFAASLVGPLAAVVGWGHIEAGEAMFSLIGAAIVGTVSMLYVTNRARGLFGPRPGIGAGAGAAAIPAPRP